MTKTSFDNVLPFSFLLFPQTPMNGELPINVFFEVAQSQARFASLCGDEAARFAAHRLEQDQEFLAELAGCRDWASLGRIQTTWAAALVKDCLQQSGQVFALLQQLSSEAAAPPKKEKPKAKKPKAKSKPVVAT